MNMGKILLNEVLSHADKLKEEIKKRLKCEIVDFEIVEYESREIGVHWNATYKSKASYVDIPYKWIVAMVFIGMKDSLACMQTQLTF